MGFQGGLADVSGHETGPVHFHQLPLGQHADGLVEPSHQPGHCGFSCARIAQKDHVEGERGRGEAGFLPKLTDLNQVHQAADLGLNGFQSTQLVQLRQQGLCRGLFRRGGGSGGLRAWGGDRRRRRGGGVGQGKGRGYGASRQALPLPLGEPLVQIGGDSRCCLRGPWTGGLGEEGQRGGQGIQKGPGGPVAGLAVVGT